MKYETCIEEMDGAMHTDDVEGVPCEAAHPWEMFEKLVVYCRENHLMPKAIYVDPPSSVCNTGESE